MAIFRRYSLHQLVQAVLTMGWRQHKVSAGDLHLHVRSFIQTHFLGNRFRDPYSQAVAPFCNPRAQRFLFSPLSRYTTDIHLKLGFRKTLWAAALPSPAYGAHSRPLNTPQHPLDREHLAWSAGPEFFWK